MKRLTAGGGFPAIWYTVKQARAAGGLLRMLRAMTSRNACKTCALGMGGQQGGMTNELGRFPEVCKKSVQAMAADMQGAIREGFFDEFGFDQLSRFTPRELENSGQLATPLIARPGERSFRVIGWDEALAETATAMGATTPDESFFYFSGRSSNEAAFLLQLVARLYGTNNINNCSYFCHQASGVGLRSVTGTGTATVTLEDADRADLLVLIGGNPASNHPRLMRTIIDLKRRGGRVIVINPLRELGLVRFKVPSDPLSLLFGSTIADEYVRPHIGGDMALLYGVARVLIERGQVDRAYVERFTQGVEEFERAARAYPWEEIERRSGVGRAEIERIATMLAASERTLFAWTMGITHHEHGVENVQMIANVALLRGMVGRPGCGLLPLRGHSNVQGIGSMGAVPDLKWPVLKAMQERFGVTLPTATGLDTLGCVERAGAGRMRFALHLGGNLFGSCPDSARATEALSKIDTTVFLSTTLNTGHVHGRGRTSIILPVLARDEEPEPTTQESMFNYVRLSEGGRPRHRGPRSEVELIAALARAVLGDRTPLDLAAMQSTSTVREHIAAIIPGYAPARDMHRSGREFVIDGRVFHEPVFKTESGRARFHAPALPALRGEDQPGTLRLMTIRSEGQFNTVVYEEEDIYRGNERRDVIMLSPEDMAERGLKSDDVVTVSSEVGRMEGMLVRPAEIRAGNAAMYYPEANVLVPDGGADPKSRTPSFKNVLIRIERSRRLAVLASGH
ncbi:MAG: FdhF/YdeP family oxidoreductase [Phycisphaerales bacterium]